MSESDDAPRTGGGDDPARTRRRRMRRAVLALIGLLYVVSVPWYRSADSPVELVAGLPDWVATALACYVGVAILNGVAWLLTEVHDPEDAGSA